MKKRVIVGVLTFGLVCGSAGVYAGTVIDQYKTPRGNTATVEKEEVHKNRIGLSVDGKSVKSDSWYANKTTYIPLREVSELLGADVEYDSKTMSAKITKAGNLKPPVDKPASGKINAGTYKIGTDLAAGEYLVFSKGDFSYLENTKDSTGNIGSIIFNEILTDGAHTYVTLNNGNYFKMDDAEMYTVESAPSVIPKDGIYKNGMYKVGQDIPAGEYKLSLINSGDMGYIEVNSDSRHSINSIITNEIITHDTYLTVSEGQYLTLDNVQIKR